MKKIETIIISALICGMALTSCSSEKTESQQKNSNKLIVVGSNSAVTSAGEAGLVFVGDDVVSYNVTSGEIVFTKEKFNEIISRLNLHSLLHFFIDEKPVFNPPIQIHYGWGVNLDDFDLQFRTDGRNIHLSEWYYMMVDSLPEVAREKKRIELAENKEHRKKELETFVDYFRNAGKIVKSNSLPPYLQQDSIPKQ